MTRVVLLHAGPTQWDVDGRITGSHTLPLTPEAVDTIRAVVERIDFTVNAVYRCRENEATDQAARIAAQRFRVRPRDAAGLEELDVGLWEGLKPNQLKSRFPSAFPQWQEDPLSVNPPDGESLADAIGRLGAALGKILSRNRDASILIAVRPMAMQVLAGLLRLRTPQQIGEHLHDRLPVETIDIADEDLHRYAE